MLKHWYHHAKSLKQIQDLSLEYNVIVLGCSGKSFSFSELLAKPYWYDIKTY